MRRFRNKLIENSERHNRFAFTPILLPLVLIAIAIGLYYFLFTQGFFPLWIPYLYVALKIFIALEVILVSAKTIVMPIVIILAGLLLIFLNQVHSISLLSNAETMQIIFLGVFGVVISLLVKW